MAVANASAMMGDAFWGALGRMQILVTGGAESV